MKKHALIVFLLLAAARAFAFEINNPPLLQEGEYRISLGGGILYGAISPPSSFNQTAGLNGAKIYEENFRYARGLGDDFLKEMYVETESKTFQSQQETINGVLVYGKNNGWVINARSGGNFLHTPHWILGGWIHGGSPILMNKSKFVNPAMDYIGAGLNSTMALSDWLGLNQTAFIGSGLFLPRKRNPNIQGSMLALFNFGKLVGTKDFILKAGGEAQTDLTSRVDASYQASSLGSGRIKNMGFSTPFLVELSLGQGWRLDGGYTRQWLGKSVRGSRWITFNLSRTL